MYWQLLPLGFRLGQRIADYFNGPSCDVPPLPDEIHYRWIPAWPNDVQGLMPEGFLTLRDFREACLGQGEFGRRLWNRLADDLNQLQRLHASKVIMVKLTPQ